MVATIRDFTFDFPCTMNHENKASHVGKSIWLDFHSEAWLEMVTPLTINMSPKKGPFQKEIHLPTIDFQGTC